MTSDETHDRIYGPGETEALREHAKKMDSRVLFDGRTVLVTSVFRTVVDPAIISERVRRASAGPLLRMTIGGLERRKSDHALLVKSFVNTDEDMKTVADRVAAVVPTPDRVEVGIVRAHDAAELWGSLHHAIDGGD